MTLSIRSYRPSDLAAIRDVCVRTGDLGGDATGQFVTDELLPCLYAYPYVRFAPDLAWVVERREAGEEPGAGTVVGYILGAENVLELGKWWQETYLPIYESALPVDETWTDRDRRVRARGEDPLGNLRGHIDAFPAEFHIDLLPEAQGGGLGRKLVTVFCVELDGRGVGGLAIGVAADNRGAMRFYGRLGFEELEVYKEGGVPGGYLLGLDIPKYLAGEREAGRLQ